MRRGRKETNRTEIVYTRVSPENAKWFKKTCKQKRKSYSETMDRLLTAYRENTIRAVA